DVGVLVGTDVTNPAPLVAVLTERIRRYGGQANVEESFNDKHGAWITLGRTAPGDKVANIPEIPDRPEGYVMASGKVDGKPVVVLRGRDRLGLLWAISSFNQIVHVQDGKTLARTARVRDYPVSLHRGYLGGEDTLWKSVRYNITFKFNNPVYKHLAFGPGIGHPSIGFRDIDNQPVFEREYIRQLAKTLTPLGIKWIAGMHPYGSAREYKMSGAPEDIDLLAQYAERIAAAGGNFGIWADDVRPFLNPFDAKAFGLISRTDVHILNTLADRVCAKYPDARFVFCPMWYFGPRGDFSAGYDAIYTAYDASMLRGGLSWYGESSRKYGEYFGDHLSDKVDLTWTGPNVKSPAAKKVELEVITKCWRRPPVFHQNYAGFWLVTDPVKSWPEWMDVYFLENTRGYMINEYHPVLEATVADFCWNPTAYDPERSIREALGKLAGAENFDHLRRADSMLVCFRKYSGRIQELLYDTNVYRPCREAAMEIETLEARLAEVKAIHREIVKRRPGSLEWLMSRDWIPAGYEMFVNRTRQCAALELYLKTGEQQRRAIKKAGFNPDADVFMASCSFSGGELLEDRDVLTKDKRVVMVLSGYKRSARAEFELDPATLSNAWTLVISAQAGERAESCPLKVKVNEMVVHRGKTPFVSKEWAIGKFEVPGQALVTTNTVSIECLDAGDSFSPEPDLKLDYIFMKRRPAFGPN
ncbi:MAG: beta-N-acetylglucosaminidase domain-containing protein, partial [Kiritimatiellae bacterium]|nr:beta-N-acetylglucosaminidase domain-containing protein [Kiritimatiellia bacterium]